MATSVRVRRVRPPRGAAFDALEAHVEAAVAQGLIPGAVVAVGRSAGRVFCRAFGARAIRPRRERMTTRTLFDLASLTKPMVTGPLAATFMDRGILRPDDPLEAHLAEVRGSELGSVPLAMLLTHTAGLPPYNRLADYQSGKRALYRAIAREPLEARPGVRFQYSDVGYVLIQAVLERRGGRRLDRLAERDIFRPLGLRDTRFGVCPADVPRTAPTTCERGRWLRGRVHDPRARARALGGIAGHAGIFGTAEEVARYCGMMLRGGVARTRVLSKAAHDMLTTSQCPASIGARRGFGFDIESAYSAPRGEGFSSRSYGHTGFTGVSLWIDPVADAYVVVLSNAIHPDGHKDLKEFRARASTLAARALATGRIVEVPS